MHDIRLNGGIIEDYSDNLNAFIVQAGPLMTEK
jgi:hypothetical protein